jgi:hypothetical protein
MKIPIIKATQELPRIPVTATTQGAGRAWGALARLGEQAQAIGLDLAETQQRIRMTTELTQAEIDMEYINKDIETKLRLNPDPDTYVEAWGKQFSEAATKRLEGVKGVRTRAAVEQLISRIASREIPKQKDYANRLWEQTESAQRIVQIDSFIKNGQLSKAIEVIDKSVADGLWNPEEAARLKITKTDTFNFAMARREIDLNPAKVDEIIEKYNISPEKTIALQERAVVLQTRREREAEKAQEAALKENAFGLWQNYEAVKNDPEKLISLNFMIEDYATLRKIEQDEYLALKKAIRTEEEAEEDNPYVVADLTDLVEMGMDIRETLTKAYNSGDLKRETYLGLRKAITTTNYKEGLAYIVDSMKPTQFEKWNPDIAQRFADAKRDYSMRVAEGEDPYRVSKEIVDLNIGDRRRTLIGLRRPRFLEGEKAKPANIEAAEKATTEAYNNGKITADEFNREAELLRDLKEVAIQLLEEPKGNAKELEKRLKKEGSD